MVKNRKDLSSGTPRRCSLKSAISRPRNVPNANIKVVVRVRPNNSREVADNLRTVVKVIDQQTLIFDGEEEESPFFFHGVQQKGRDILKKAHRNIKFTYDSVFDENADNNDVFAYSTKALIDTLMDGCNCSVFVYGATGAGKTHTMLGNKNSIGITFLTMEELFRQRNELSNDREFELAVSYLEIYNENVQDLLKPGGPPLHLREDAKLGVMVAGITIKRIENPDELYNLLEKGNRCRTQHPTDANAESSRSHAVFQVYIRMKLKSTGQTQIAKLSMIDLAGSERASATGCKGDRFTEGANINKSLLALGNCINSLADGKRHVPYRDSKLTRVLKDSLGGNCSTVMIANVSPSSLSFEDTYNTLKYAMRAKKIKANVKKNVVTSNLNHVQYVKVIEELNNELMKLKEQKNICQKCMLANETHSQETNSVDSIRTMSANSQETITSDKVTENLSQSSLKVQSLFDDYKSSQERLHKLQRNQKMVDVRVHLKEEVQNRLSGFCMDTDHKEKDQLKLEQSMDRLKKQSIAYNSDLTNLKFKLQMLQRDIDKVKTECPEIKMTVDLEQAKIDRIIAEYKLEELQSLYDMQQKELLNRLDLMLEMQTLLKPWFLILKETGFSTNLMVKDYERLCSRLQGACCVNFEEGDQPICLSTTIVLPEDEVRASKRKLEIDLNPNSTFTKSPASNKISVDQILKVYPSPAKRLAKSSAVLKENRALIRKVTVGTMGTASRFPVVHSKVKKNIVREPLVVQRSKINKSPGASKVSK